MNMTDNEGNVVIPGEDTAVAATTDAAALRQQAEAQSQEIEEQTRQQPLTGTQRPIATLAAEQYKDSPNYLVQLQQLETSYRYYRPIRGDGDCYYRAFLYSLVEHVLLANDNDNDDATTTDESQEQQFHQQRQRQQRRDDILTYFKVTSWKNVLAAGYSEMALEIFHDCMVELLENLTTMEAFHAIMNIENDVSDYCTWYMRAITAAYLKQPDHTDRFLPFCYEFHCHDMNEFCARHVEPMHQECEQVQVLALAEATGVAVRIEYVDGRSSNNGHNGGGPVTIQAHTFGPDDATVHLTLLYRPGHYDILYT
jgi:ubiquitin thioesterase protein OTUB1